MRSCETGVALFVRAMGPSARRGPNAGESWRCSIGGLRCGLCWSPPVRACASAGQMAPRSGVRRIDQGMAGRGDILAERLAGSPRGSVSWCQPPADLAVASWGVRGVVATALVPIRSAVAITASDAASSPPVSMSGSQSAAAADPWMGAIPPRAADPRSSRGLSIGDMASNDFCG